MAGGKGERFWPLSTGNVPKPFLQLTGEKTLIQLTVERALRFVPKKRIFIVLGKKHLRVAQKQLPELPPDNFIVEPAGRDTAACIGLAAITLLILDDKATMVVLPADQYVPDIDKFADTMRHCVDLAQEGSSLITMGITPTRPETGYGYIKAGKDISSFNNTCFVVDAYVEKPDLKKAAQYIHDGNYYWNAGIFIWQVGTVLKGMKQHMPNLYKGLIAIEEALREGKNTKADAIFKDFERKSIDYGLMEKARNVLMVPALFKWDDVGTWASLQRILNLDKDGNYKQGNTICIDTKGSVLVGGNLVIATIGVSDLIVVASKKGILICSKERVQDVREIAKIIEAKQ
jgi:mannose-1-phosphate guanylyltransferase